VTESGSTRDVSHSVAFIELSTDSRAIEGASVEHFGTFRVRRGAFRVRLAARHASRGTRLGTVVGPFGVELPMSRPRAMRSHAERPIMRTRSTELEAHSLRADRPNGRPGHHFGRGEKIPNFLRLGATTCTQVVLRIVVVRRDRTVLRRRCIPRLAYKSWHPASAPRSARLAAARRGAGLVFVLQHGPVLSRDLEAEAQRLLRDRVAERRRAN
jgi:hypothetical protein